MRAWLEGVSWQKSCKIFAKNVEKMAKFFGVLAKKFRGRGLRAWLEGRGLRAWLEGVGGRAWQKSCNIFAKKWLKLSKLKISRAWREGVDRGRGLKGVA